MRDGARLVGRDDEQEVAARPFVLELVDPEAGKGASQSGFAPRARSTKPGPKPTVTVSPAGVAASSGSTSASAALP